MIEKEAVINGIGGTWEFTGAPVREKKESGWKFKVMRYRKYKQVYEGAYNQHGYVEKLGYHAETKVCIIAIPPGRLRRGRDGWY